MAIREWDAIVDATGKGDFETVQAADDAHDGGAYMLYVKTGSYAGFTIATANAWVFCEPNTVFTSAITLSGAGVLLELSAGCDVQGLLTLSGIGSSAVCENGVDIDGILCSAASCYVTGGGWDTLSAGGTADDGLRVTAADCIFEDIATQTTGGGGASKDGISVEEARASFVKVKVVDSDDLAVRIGDFADTLLLGCLMLNADDDGIRVGGARSRLIGNYVINGANNILGQSTGDDSVYYGNISQDASTSALQLLSGADDSVVVGNRTDGTITDSSSSSTVAQNGVSSF